MFHLVAQLPSAPFMQSFSISVTGRSSGSRSDFLDVLVGDEDEFGLLQERLPSLRRLHFQLQDGGADYLKWWMKGITGRLPSIGDLVHVEIERGKFLLSYLLSPRSRRDHLVMEGGWSEAPRSSPGLSRLVMNVRTPTVPSS